VFGVSFLTAPSGPAVAADLVFRIVKVPGLPIAGTIWVNEGQSGIWRKFRDVPASGTITVADYRCNTAGTFFSASVGNPKLKLVDETQSEKDCNLGTIPFEFEEKRYALVLENVITGKELQTVARTANIDSLQRSLKEAYEEGDTEKSLKMSSQISTILRSLGYSYQAKAYQTYNFDLAKSKISGPTELTFDPKQKGYVLSEQDLEKLKKVQAANGLDANGSLGWRTMEALSKIEGRI